VSKTYGVDLIDYATKAMVPGYDLEPLVLPEVAHVGVKVSFFFLCFVFVSNVFLFILGATIFLCKA